MIAITGGQDDPAFWKRGSANEKVQRFPIEASKILEFDTFTLRYLVSH
jgi:hypothetical protein